MRHRFLLLGLLLAGCSGQSPTVVAVVQPDAPVTIPPIGPLTMDPVEWQVMTLPQLKKLVANLEAAHSNQTIYALSPKNYNNLALNMREIERYVNEQKAVLTMLKSIITERSAKKAQQAPTP